MSKKQEEKIDNEELNTQSASEETTDTAAEAQTEAQEAEAADEEIENDAQKPAEESLDDKINKLTEDLEKANKEYLFLMAEFDNFRKRTVREKADIIRNAGEKVLGQLLPIIDDFERAIKANEQADDIDAIKQGVTLIYNKLIKYLEQNQVKAIESTGCDFDTELHEAVTTFPAPSEDLKGKVIDTVMTGYTINDKVLRHAKVVVGQ
ncbi:MAG: nucleotide exchange factor GrpE [Muribaculaceae bacterium]